MLQDIIASAIGTFIALAAFTVPLSIYIKQKLEDSMLGGFP